MMASDDDPIQLVDPRREHFALESGDHGDLWLDLDRLFRTPRDVAPFASRLAERLSRIGFDVVCGPVAGGAVVAELVAKELDLPFISTAQVVLPGVAGGDAPWLVTYRLPDGIGDALAGRKVAVVDDAINAGSAVGGTLRALRAAGAVPVVVAALLDLGESRANPTTFDGLPLVSLATLRARLWTPAECPLCAAGIPLDAVGDG